MLRQTPGQPGGPAPALPRAGLPAQKAGQDSGQGKREIGGSHRKGSGAAKGKEGRIGVWAWTQG